MCGICLVLFPSHRRVANPSIPKKSLPRLQGASLGHRSFRHETATAPRALAAFHGADPLAGVGLFRGGDGWIDFFKGLINTPNLSEKYKITP